MTQGMKIVAPKEQHEAFRLKLIGLFRQHQYTVDAQEMLAISSYFVGQLVALQDQRKVTPDQAMKIVEANLAEGNRQVVRNLMEQTGGMA